MAGAVKNLFEAIPEPAGASEDARRENKFFEKGAHARHPNSVFVPFFGGFISWHSENGIAVLALLILVCLGAVAVCTIFALIFVSDRSWAVEFLKVIAQAMLAVAGAIIGAGASSGARRSR